MIETSQTFASPHPRGVGARWRGFRVAAAVALVCATLGACTGEQFQKGYILPPGALEQIHDRVAAIVWLDAFKPENGQKGTDFASEFSRKALEEAVAKGEPGRKWPPAKTFSLSEKDYAWIDSKLTLQPNGVATQPIVLSGKRETIAKKTYIRAPKYPQAAFDKALAECKADATWQTFVNDDTGHDVMIDQPQWLVDVLLKVS